MRAASAAGASEVLDGDVRSSVLAFVARVRMKVAMAGHQASMVLFRRVASGMSAMVASRLNVARTSCA